MIRNYILIALRNIRRNLSHTVINVTGLSLGITCSLVLFLMVRFLTSFDNYHPNADRIYRVVHSSIHSDREDFTAGIPVPLPGLIRSDLGGVQQVLFISGRGGGLVTIEKQGNKQMFEEEDGFAYTDSLYFTFFHQPLLRGSASLKNPDEAVISEKLAAKYFPDEDPIGRIFRLDNEKDIKITGVMKDPVKNTCLPFDLLISYETVRVKSEEAGWNSIDSDNQCYVMLPEGSDLKSIDASLLKLVNKNDNEEDRKVNYWLQPLRELHYDNRFHNYAHKSVDKESIWAMGIIALFLVITSSINFVNLATAVASKRSREVGIRKVMGSQRGQLVLQYLNEAGFITLFSLLVSVGLAELSLIRLNSFLDLNLHIDLADNTILLFLAGTWLVVSIASGLYPAFLLSGFSPVSALKSKITSAGSKGYLRKGLVVVQFVISQFLIVGTVILLMQMRYFNNKDLGFVKEAVITIPVPEDDNIGKKRNLKAAVSTLPGVEGVSLCRTAPASGSISRTSFTVDGIEGNYVTQVKISDADYLDLFKIEFVAGNNPQPGDTARGWVVNEKLVKMLGLADAQMILGRKLNLWDKDLPVMGVVKDFHAASLSREIDPVILFPDLQYSSTLAIKLTPGEFNATVKKVESAWSALYPDFLFQYTFLDQDIKRFYEDTQRMSVLLVVFSCIAIAIGCLGLYGLVSFMANQKEKEIGVRKVLGASTGQIMWIFSKEFVLLIFIAFLIASPLAGYIMNKWLEDFAYRISIHWSVFAVGIVFTMVIALLTVSYRAVRAAIANPVDTLRME